jgi:hypothetical protein
MFQFGAVASVAAVMAGSRFDRSTVTVPPPAVGGVIRVARAWLDGYAEEADAS